MWSLLFGLFEVSLWDLKHIIDCGGGNDTVSFEVSLWDLKQKHNDIIEAKGKCLKYPYGI